MAETKNSNSPINTVVASKSEKIVAAIIGWFAIFIVPLILEWPLIWLFGFKIGGFLKILSLVLTILFVIVYYWAPRGVWFTIIGPETAKPFTFLGSYWAFMISSSVLTYQKDDIYFKNDLVPLDHSNAKPRHWCLCLWIFPMVIKCGGLVFFLWPIVDIYSWKFRWNRSKIAEQGILKEDFSETIIDYIFLKRSVYSNNYPDLEDSDMTSFGAKVLAETEPINPFKCVIRNHDSLSAVIKSFESVAREVSKTRTLNEWKHGHDLGEDLDKRAREIPMITPQNPNPKSVYTDILDKFGYYMRFKVANVIPPETMQNAAARKTAAETEADIVRTKARGEADAIRTKADAEVYRIDKVYEAVAKFGNEGVLLKALESMEKSQLTASYVVANVPGLAELFKEAMGVPKGQTPTQTQISNLKKKVKRGNP